MPGNWKSIDGRWTPMDEAARQECRDLKITGRGIHVTKDPEFQIRASRVGLSPEKYLERLRFEHKQRLEEEAMAMGVNESVPEPQDKTAIQEATENAEVAHAK